MRSSSSWKSSHGSFRFKILLKHVLSFIVSKKIISKPNCGVVVLVRDSQKIISKNQARLISRLP